MQTIEAQVLALNYHPARHTPAQASDKNNFGLSAPLTIISGLGSGRITDNVIELMSQAVGEAASMAFYISDNDYKTLTIGSLVRWPRGYHIGGTAYFRRGSNVRPMTSRQNVAGSGTEVTGVSSTVQLTV